MLIYPLSYRHFFFILCAIHSSPEYKLQEIRGEGKYQNGSNNTCISVLTRRQSERSTPVCAIDAS